MKKHSKIFNKKSIKHSKKGRNTEVKNIKPSKKSIFKSIFSLFIRITSWFCNITFTYIIHETHSFIEFIHLFSEQKGSTSCFSSTTSLSFSATKKKIYVAQESSSWIACWKNFGTMLIKKSSQHEQQHEACSLTLFSCCMFFILNFLFYFIFFLCDSLPCSWAYKRNNMILFCYSFAILAFAERLELAKL